MNISTNKLNQNSVNIVCDNSSCGNPPARCTKWSGRNLNLGFSVRPFEDFGLVFTSMWNNLLQNCDYGCKVDVPDYPEGAPIPDNMTTERAVWSFRLSVDMKF